MTKRQKFVFASLCLSLGLLTIQVANISWRYQAIALLVLLTPILSAWALKDALSGIKWLTTLILPTLFTAGVGLFYFLLPSTLLARLPVAGLYALGLYALLLTENIFSVAAIRTIQLLRAAHAVGFLLTLLTAFFLYDTIFSFRLHPWWNGLLVILTSWPLFFQGLWSVNLEDKLTRRILVHTGALGILTGELAFAISFWPVTVAMGSLFLTTVCYATLGLIQAHFQERLFRQTFYEYLGVGIIVLLTMIFTTHWGG